MTMHDDLGLALSGADTDSLTHYRRALRQFQCYIEDPVASVDAALAQRPDFVMAHILKAWLHLLGTEHAAIPVARECHAAAIHLPANARERGHLAAISHLLDGQWHRAARVLEDIAIDHPHDVLALQAGHLTDFYVGNARMLRDRIARAFPRWSHDMPGYHAMRGMLAFGLEESGDYISAEAHGRAGVELEPRDGWAQHAVAHVMEMQGRERDGIAWMRANPAAWSTDSFFRVHNWWHLALFHLELGETDEVLALYDSPIRGDRSMVILDMVDASAMLWRLKLRSIDTGTRWQELADAWKATYSPGHYAFNDVHAAMAYVGAGRFNEVDDILAAQTAIMRDDADNAAFTQQVGEPLVCAIQAFGQGKYRDTITLIRNVRGIAHRFGGSHAQRSVLDLTLIEAALRSGEHALAAALCAERLATRPHSPFTQQLLCRTAPLKDNAAAA